MRNPALCICENKDADQLLDFRKAFELVDHKILLNKLSLYNFSKSSLKGFESYLDSRQQAMQSKKG